jgi:hypothetical protein
VGPRAVLDAVVKRKIPSPGRESNPRISIVQSVRLILKTILGETCVKVWFGLKWLRIRSIVGLYEHGDDLSGSIKPGNFLTN